MKVLLVAGGFPQRSETFIYRKAVSLARAGHDVTVAARKRGDWDLYPDPLPDNLHVDVLPNEAVQLHNVPSWIRGIAKRPRDLTRLWKLSTAARSSAEARRQFVRHLGLLNRSVDVAHFEFLGLAMLYPFAGELLDAPIVVSCRGQDIHLLAIRQPGVVAAHVACLRRATLIHCVSEELATSVRELTGRTDGIVVNRPAVEVDTIAPRTGADSGRLRIVAAGRLVWVKGFEYLLRALALLNARGVDFEAEILGDGELYSQLRYTIADLGIAARVSLRGGVSGREVLDRMQRSDVYVLSSHAEGISNSVLEAMATGLAIVTTAAGGMAEAITDGVEGFVVPIRDPDAMATRLEQLAHDPRLRLRMGRAARQRATGEFSTSRQIQGFTEIYERAIASGK